MKSLTPWGLSDWGRAGQVEMLTCSCQGHAARGALCQRCQGRLKSSKTQSQVINGHVEPWQPWKHSSVRGPAHTRGPACTSPSVFWGWGGEHCHAQDGELLLW